MDTSTAEAYEIAVRLLARREHSRHELQRKLKLRGLKGWEIEDALSLLNANDLQSDDRFVETCVRTQLRKGHGPLKIRGYLTNHGIQNSKISEHLSNDDEFWIQKALQVDFKCRIRNEISDCQALEREMLQLRARYLENRGYPSSVIFRVLNAPLERTSD